MPVRKTWRTLQLAALVNGAVDRRVGACQLSALMKIRVGGANNASLRARLRANRRDRKAREAHGLKPYPWTLIAKPLRKVGQWQIR